MYTPEFHLGSGWGWEVPWNHQMTNFFPFPDLPPLLPYQFRLQALPAWCVALPELHMNLHLGVCFWVMFASKGGVVEWVAVEKNRSPEAHRLEIDWNFSVTTYMLAVKNFRRFLNSPSLSLLICKVERVWPTLRSCCEVGHVICVIPCPLWVLYTF